jgi:hypothetical protein
VGVPQETQPTPDATPLSIQEQLCTLLGRPVQLRLRTTPEGQVSLIDVTMIFTGFNNDDAAKTVRRVFNAYPDLRAECQKFKFPGRGQKTIDVAKVDVIRRFTSLLGGRNAAAARCGLPVTKRALRRDHLYVMQYVFDGVADDTSVKIGKSDDCERRRRELQSCQRFYVKIAGIFEGCGGREKEVHDKLRHLSSDQCAGVEWFDMSAAKALETLRAILQQEEVVPEFTEDLSLKKKLRVSNGDREGA